MKTTKKLSIITMALMLAFVFSYQGARAVTVPTDKSGDRSHTLILENEATELPAGEIVVYSFQVGDPIVVDGDVTNVSAAVSGKPSIADITYNDQTGFSGTPASHTQKMVIDWSNTTFNYAGVYAFPVEKSINTTASHLTKKLTNNHPGSTTTSEPNDIYLLANVTYNATTKNLEVSDVQVYSKFDPTSKSSEIDGTEKGNVKDNINDTWDAPSVSLSVQKEVDGAKGAKDMYFKFDIEVTMDPDEVSEYTTSPNNSITLRGDFDSQPNAPAYGQIGQAFTNPQTIEFSTTGTTAGKGKISVWLKHGQTVTIPSLPYGVSYKIVETNNGGSEGEQQATDEAYSVTTSVLNGGDNYSGAGETTGLTHANKSTAKSVEVSDTVMQKTTTVKYLNEKEGTTPTGIILQFGAPIAGVIIVGILFGVVFMRRRNEEDYEYDE